MALADYTGGPYRELDGSREVHFSAGSSSATRKFWVLNWSDQFEFVKKIMGYATVTGSPPAINRINPDPYPEATWLYCTDAQSQPQGVIMRDTSGNIVYSQGVIVTATYHAIEYPVTGQWAYMSQKVDGVCQFVTMPQGQYVWDSTPTIMIPEPPGLPLRGLDYSITFHAVPDSAINWGTLLISQNTVNLNPLAIGIFSSIPQGCMLFLKPEAHPSFAPDGSTAWDLTYTFHLRNWDHNKAPRPSTGQFEWFRWKGAPATVSGQPPSGTLFQYIDMLTILRFPMQ